MTGVTDELLADLPAETARLLAEPPDEPQLLELSVTWPGLADRRARAASALRVFVLTWDPLELYPPRPDGFAVATVENAAEARLEIAVYLPHWRLTDLAADRKTTMAAVIGELAGSAVVTASDHWAEVMTGRYADLVTGRDFPDLLADPSGGAALGAPQIEADPPSWGNIGLAAMTDIVQHAFGYVDLDRSRVRLELVAARWPGCPACAGRDFGFPGDLGDAKERMCDAHHRQADAVIVDRTTRALESNPAGWAVLAEATTRLGIPHLPNGLATRVTAALHEVVDLPESPSAADQAPMKTLAELVVEAAEYFPGDFHDLGHALGVKSDDAASADRFLRSLTSFVVALGPSGLAAEAIAVGEALSRVSPEREPVIEAAITAALAGAGQIDEARARIEKNVSRWPESFWVRMRAGDALFNLGDDDAATAQYEAARALADARSDYQERADAAAGLRNVERRRREQAGGGAAVRRLQRTSKSSRSQRRHGR